MGLPVEINNLMMGAVGGYQIGRSLRFRSSASAYLNRTPSVASGFNQWTLSVWFKRCSIGATQYLIGGNTTTSGFRNELQVQISSGDQLAIYAFNNGGGYYFNRFSSMLFRDPSAWYHLVVQFDPDNATSANKIIAYVNGVQVSWGSSADSGVSGSITSSAYRSINNTYRNDINGGYQSGGAPVYFSDNYLAEMNMVSGSLISPFSFGGYDSNGIWQPKKYTGTYGTNGFYLPFSNTTSTTTLVQDSSGNGNNWTPNNISLTAGTTYDSMLDVPTNNSATAANFAVLNPLNKGTNQTIANGNLTNTASAHGTVLASIGVTSGKWYGESTLSVYGAGGIGFTSNPAAESSYANLSGKWWCYDNGANFIIINQTTTSSYAVRFSAGQVWQWAIDNVNGKVWIGVNNAWLDSTNGTTGNPSTGANPTFTFTAGTLIWPFLENAGGPTWNANFGQRPFTYTPPTGFVALNTQNLPDATITKGNQHFDATLWTGDGTSPRSITNAAGFKPDLVWVKMRSGAYQHGIADSVRGGNAILHSNSTAAEDVNWQYGYLSSFNSNGFTMQSGSTSIENFNLNGSTFVGWQWKGGGTAVTNNSGTITSSVSANASAGFSVVTYTGTGANATVGHGLGVAPSMVIVKQRNAVRGWPVYHSSLTSATYYIDLQTTAAQASASTIWNSTAPTSSVFSIGTDTGTNQNTGTYVAYCFAAVSGYSAFGSYTGNGSTDGPFVFTNFRPRYVMIKNINDGTAHWIINDSSRGTYNQPANALYANISNAEDTSHPIDFYSNGFKPRSSAAHSNGSGNTIIYMAFAESPFQISRAR